MLAAGLYLLAFRAGPIHATGAVVGTGTPQSCTEAAFDAALAVVQASEDGEITFNCGGPATIIFSAVKIITVPVVIDGGDAISLSGANIVRPFYVEIGADLTLRRIVVSNGFDDTYGGGAILNLGTLTLEGTTIRNSNVDANHSGGAIMSLGLVKIYDSLIENNAGGSAGGLYLFGEAADATISNSTFRNNRTTSSTYGLGGAITTWNGADLTVGGSTLDQNTARAGGAIYNESSLTTIAVEDDTVISGNKTTDGSGGGIFNVGGSLGLAEVTLAGNQSRDLGGGIYNKSGPLNAANIVFNNNEGIGIEYGGGGGLYNSDANATLANVVFRGNIARGSENSYGGGIVNVSNGILMLRDSTLAGNSAQYGGGMANFGTLTMFNVTINGNSANTGGGIENIGTLTFYNGTISGNSASFGGGLSNSRNGNLVHVTFSDNTNGIYQWNVAGVLSLKNVVLNGSAEDNCGIDSGATGLTSAGFNLSSDNSCPFNQTGDRVNIDPRLGPLADNGGFTLTHMPLDDSPAIDAGLCVNEVTTDQRGVARPQGGACDIGAVERRSQEGEGFRLYLPVGLK